MNKTFIITTNKGKTTSKKFRSKNRRTAMKRLTLTARKAVRKGVLKLKVVR